MANDVPNRNQPKILRALDAPHLLTPKRCPNCGFEDSLRRVERDELIEGCGNVVKMRVQVDVCSHCGEPIYDLRTIGEMQAMERRLCSGETSGLIQTGVAYRAQ
ncbi:MAG TPA: YgiT-type zinc finger protein [Ktedonobacterales bacterium]|nr:YgiT-type zinc finger protein [Ktedonobacterales bacterium]